jgi:hypothetical protein
MNTDIDYEDCRIGEPATFPAPPPEVMAELRRLLPPVPVTAPVEQQRRAS